MDAVTFLEAELAKACRAIDHYRRLRDAGDLSADDGVRIFQSQADVIEVLLLKARAVSERGPGAPTADPGPRAL